MKVLSFRYANLYRLLFTLLFVSSTCCMSLAASANVVIKPPGHDARIKQQRQDYMLARQAFQRNDKDIYKQLKVTLQDYPLYPYLEYNEIIKQLDKATHWQIDQFLNDHRQSYLANQLLERWLPQLAKRKDWRSYKHYYRHNINSTALRCHYLWSQLKTGNNNIYSQVAPLWNVGKSQPDSCNRLFNEWQKKGYLTPDIAWERHKKAVNSGNYRLANYISRRMPDTMQQSAKVYRRIDKYPQEIKNQSLFRADTPINRDIIAHGLKRYARVDANAAYALWQKYQHHYALSDEEKDHIISSIAIRFAREGLTDRAMQLATSYSMSNAHADKTILITSILHELLKLQQWRDILIWIKQLPITEQQSHRWRYWRARALAHTQPGTIKHGVGGIYQELSTSRNYYGFLAADQIDKKYAFANTPAAISNQLARDVQAMPALQRSLELFALGKMYAARHEWASGVKDFNIEQHIAAAKLAAAWGWDRKAIESMATAQYWDDLNIRFPLAHTYWIDSISRTMQVSSALIYAIARQESAWAVDALSPVGAVGLMQVMPSTAKLVANKIGLSYKKRRLFQPKYNIVLGSRYINGLIRQYNGNRLPALAAYNAGPSRVKRWLAESNQKLPYDIWIEVIPFKETRKYVQNVLTYAVIYGHMMGESLKLITPDEARQRL